MDNNPKLYGSNSQFGYSPFTNEKIRFGTVTSNDVNDYTLSNRLFTREWKVHMFKSCTSALLQLILQYGVHLGDAGGFGPKDELGFFKTNSEYGKAKRNRTALLGVPHEDGYIAQLKSPVVQQDYVESVKKYLEEEMENREIRFVVLSTFMAYTAHCLSGGTLRQIKQICDNLGIQLIMDETLGALQWAHCAVSCM